MSQDIRADDPPSEETPSGNLTEGPIGPALRRLAVPMGLGIIFMMLVNLVDTWFVGRLGLEPLAAMSFTFPVVSLVSSMAIGLSVGATSAIARAIGHGDHDLVKRLTTHALLLSVLLVAIISLAGVFLQGPLFTLLGAPPELLPLLSRYMTTWFAGVVFLVVPIIANGALRAAGDARTPMLLMLTAALANLVLDPIFIFGFGPIPRLELFGAALATLLARAIVMVVTLYVLGVRRKMLIWHWPRRSELLDSWKKVLSVGVPSAITNALAPVASGVLTALIAREGEAAVAAYGIGGRLEGLMLIAPFALTAALSPFIGQNWGAHLGHRVAESVKVSLRFVILWGLGGLALLAAGAPFVAAAFTDDPEVARALTIYLRCMPLGYAAHGVVSVATTGFNAVDRAVRSTVLSATRSLLLAVPLAAGGQYFFGLPGLFLGMVLATTIAAFIGVRWLRTLLDPQAEAAAEAERPALAPSALEQALARFPDPVRPLAQGLFQHVQALPGVRLQTVRGDAVGFFVGARELGHVHPSGHIDLPLPPLVGERLVRCGRVEHHRLHHAVAWFTHSLQNGHDFEDAEWLLKLAHGLYLVRQQGPVDPLSQQELASLSLTPQLRDAVVYSAALWAGDPSRERKAS